MAVPARDRLLMARIIAEFRKGTSPNELLELVRTILEQQAFADSFSRTDCTEMPIPNTRSSERG